MVDVQEKVDQVFERPKKSEHGRLTSLFYH